MKVSDDKDFEESRMMEADMNGDQLCYVYRAIELVIYTDKDETKMKEKSSGWRMKIS